MAEIKTFRYWHDSQSDRNTVLVGKSVRPTQGPAVPAVLMGGEPATGISESPFLSFAHSSPIYIFTHFHGFGSLNYNIGYHLAI